MPRSERLGPRINPWLRALASTALLAMFVAACDSGDGGGGTVNPLEWARFRHDQLNTGLGAGLVDQNLGLQRLVLNLNRLRQPTDPPTLSVVTAATPAIGQNDSLYLGTSKGLLAVNKILDDDDPDTILWLFNGCANLPNGAGPISISGTPALTTNSNTAASVKRKLVVVGTDDGRIFVLQDNTTDVECLWVYPSPAGRIEGGVLSSPMLTTDPNDGSLNTVYVGTGAGYLLALNGDGTEQWRYPSSGSLDPLTSSPGIAGNSIVFTSPDGFLRSVDFAGRNPDQTARQVAGSAGGLFQPSAAIGFSTIHTVQPLDASDCEEDAVDDCAQLSFVTTNLDFINWQFLTKEPVVGSPVVTQLSLQIVVPPTPVPPLEPTPVATATPSLVNSLESVVFLVDEAGTVYGLRDSTGETYESFNDNNIDQKVSAQVTLPTGVVSTSPALSSDGFVVFGDDTGTIYAIQLDFDRTGPCEACDPFQRGWQYPEAGGGLVRLGTGAAIRSSPIVDRVGVIYVTTADGMLWAIGNSSE